MTEARRKIETSVDGGAIVSYGDKGIESLGTYCNNWYTCEDSSLFNNSGNKSRHLILLRNALC